MNSILITINSAAASVILLHGIFSVINLMGRDTRHAMRLAWSILTTGALGVLVGPAFGRLPPAPSWTCLLVGLALIILFDRHRPGSMRGMS